jgi:hypothetical protein
MSRHAVTSCLIILAFLPDAVKRPAFLFLKDAIPRLYGLSDKPVDGAAFFPDTMAHG